jgi:hypothetical protein
VETQICLQAGMPKVHLDPPQAVKPDAASDMLVCGMIGFDLVLALALATEPRVNIALPPAAAVAPQICEEVDIVRLYANPDKWDGKLICTRAVLVVDPHGVRLWSPSEGYDPRDVRLVLDMDWRAAVDAGWSLQQEVQVQGRIELVSPCWDEGRRCRPDARPVMLREPIIVALPADS